MPEPHWSGRIIPPETGSGGGASSLTDLTDVTGDPGPGKSPVGDASGMFPLVPVTTQDDLDAVLAQVAAVDQHHIGDPGEPPFAANWRNIGDPWAVASYRHLANSTVRLQGTVMCQDQTIQDATWIPVFTLPAELAPAGNLEFGVLTNDNAISKVAVWSDGNVVWCGYMIGTHAPVSRLPLNGLSWSTTGPAPMLAAAVAARFDGG